MVPISSAASRIAAVVDYSYDGTMRSVEQSLLRLGTDRIDLLLIHDVDVWTHGAEAIEARFREAMAGAYVALDKLRGEGVVKGIGIGVNEAEMCVRFAKAGHVRRHAARRSLFAAGAAGARRGSCRWRRPRGLASCSVACSTPASWRPVRSPAPSTITRTRRRIADAEGRRHRTRSAVIMAWRCRPPRCTFALGHPAVASLVLGAQTPQEVERNVAALSVTPFPPRCGVT